MDIEDLYVVFEDIIKKGEDYKPIIDCVGYSIEGERVLNFLDLWSFGELIRDFHFEFVDDIQETLINDLGVFNIDFHISSYLSREECLWIAHFI